MEYVKGRKCSKNFKLHEKIVSLDRFYNVLQNHKSIFWNFKVFPTAFFYSWTIRTIYNSMIQDRFWTIKKI